jgi:hypothetical protein
MVSPLVKMSTPDSSFPASPVPQGVGTNKTAEPALLLFNRGADIGAGAVDKFDPNPVKPTQAFQSWLNGIKNPRQECVPYDHNNHPPSSYSLGLKVFLSRRQVRKMTGPLTPKTNLLKS